MGDTPGPLGVNDNAAPAEHLRGPPDNESLREGELSEDPVSGSVPIGIGAPGVPSVVRIPVPGPGNLFVELKPRGWVPQQGSTSTLFIQDASGGRRLRLDFGFNKATGKVDYHWNQKGTFEKFGVPNHTPAGKGGAGLYRSAKYLRWGGRVLLIAGAAVDAVSIVVAEKKWRQVARVAAGWTGAWAGCKLVGAGGAKVGTLVKPGLGTAVGGLGGCLVGSVAGYGGASWVAGETYDYIEETYFQELPETQGPPDASWIE
jgi:hypothetical protein